MRDRMNKLIFEKYEDVADEWRWRLKAANGKVLGASCDGFTKAHCNKVVERLARSFRRGGVDVKVKTVVA